MANANPAINLSAVIDDPFSVILPSLNKKRQIKFRIKIQYKIVAFDDNWTSILKLRVNK